MLLLLLLRSKMPTSTAKHLELRARWCGVEEYLYWGFIF